MTRLEYVLSAAVLRVIGLLFSVLPIRRNRVALATARTSRLDGNLLHIHRALRRLRPDLEVALDVGEQGASGTDIAGASMLRKRASVGSHTPHPQVEINGDSRV